MCVFSAKELKANGAQKISIFVPHACFPKGEYTRFLGKEVEGIIDKFYTTDSVKASIDKIGAIEKQTMFEIIPLAQVLIDLKL